MSARSFSFPSGVQPDVSKSYNTALDPGKVQVLSPEHFKGVLPVAEKGRQWVRIGVHGEGSCWYHSLMGTTDPGAYFSLSVPDRFSAGRSFRCGFQDRFTRKVYDCLSERHPHNVHFTYEKAKAAFCSPTVWAEPTAIKTSSDLLQFNACVLDLSTQKFNCTINGHDAPQKWPLVVIAWVNMEHFEPVAQLKVSSGAQNIVTMWSPGSATHTAVLKTFDTCDIAPVQVVLGEGEDGEGTM